MVLANLRLVHFVAQRYTGRGLPLEDLLQEGAIGLITAVERFDWRRDVRFATFAVWWIRERILRALTDCTRTIRLPANVRGLLARAREAEQRLAQQLERQPHHAEVAHELNIAADRLLEIWAHRSSPVSLDRKVGEDGTSLAELLVDPASTDTGVTYSAAATLQASERAQALESLLQTLTDRERRVLEQRFGFGESSREVRSPVTLAEVGAGIGLSPERVRQIESVALAKLRHRARMRPWRDVFVT